MATCEDSAPKQTMWSSSMIGIGTNTNLYRQKLEQAKLDATFKDLKQIALDAFQSHFPYKSKLHPEAYVLTKKIEEVVQTQLNLRQKFPE